MDPTNAAASFICKTCQEEHVGLPDLGFQYPDPYLEVPESERAARTTVSPDVCTVLRDDADTDYFIRGVIELPLLGGDETWGIGVWVSQSRENFESYVAGEVDEPTFGWIVSDIRGYEPSTMFLKARVRFRSDGLRPTIELQPTEHPLSVEQRDGISLQRAWEIIHPYL